MAPICPRARPPVCARTANALQTEMRKLEQVVHSIHIELQNIRRKEEMMRNVNGVWVVYVFVGGKGGRRGQAGGNQFCGVQRREGGEAAQCHR